MNRRSFLGLLAALPAMTALAGAGVRIPKRTVVYVEPRLAKTSWQMQSHTPLREDSIVDLLNQLRDNEVLGMYHVRPTKLIVQSHLKARAEYILTHRPGLLERLWWHLTAAAA